MAAVPPGELERCDSDRLAAVTGGPDFEPGPTCWARYREGIATEPDAG